MEGIGTSLRLGAAQIAEPDLAGIAEPLLCIAPIGTPLGVDELGKVWLISAPCRSPNRPDNRQVPSGRRFNDTYRAS
ncbi:MAG: hypothetical protein AAFP84_17595 [Actinomycetota bacterium]